VETVAVSELGKYKLDLVAEKEVRWVNVGSQPVDDYTYFYRNGNVNHHLGTGVLYIRESDQQLRG